MGFVSFDESFAVRPVPFAFLRTGRFLDVMLEPLVPDPSPDVRREDGRADVACTTVEGGQTSLSSSRASVVIFIGVSRSTAGGLFPFNMVCFFFLDRAFNLDGGIIDPTRKRIQTSKISIVGLLRTARSKVKRPGMIDRTAKHEMIHIRHSRTQPMPMPMGKIIGFSALFIVALSIPILCLA